MNILDKMRLDGKTAYVTGGARGIGKNIAAALSQAGAAVVIADLDYKEAVKTAEELTQAGAEAKAVYVDVTSQEAVAAMMEFIVKSYGSVEIGVNNAGICMNTPAEEMSLEQWRRVLDINLTGVFLTAQAAGRQMIRQGHGGSIINIASMSAHIVNIPQPQCAYNASKAGVIQLTKSLAVEWCDHQIRVNSISPGYVGTELTLNSPALKPLITEWEASSPMHRMARPDELQGIALYLAGDTASFTTGSDFAVDGAFTAV